ncbi:hypothetical protein SEA_BERKA_26 [Arthrobacter phage Berka]|nr:hypothetical protein SEA_BERKA_26 [Arthrobacter phage Berka]
MSNAAASPFAPLDTESRRRMTDQDVLKAGMLEAQRIYTAAQTARDIAWADWSNAYWEDEHSPRTAQLKRIYRLKVDEADRAETAAGKAAEAEAAGRKARKNANQRASYARRKAA